MASQPNAASSHQIHANEAQFHNRWAAETDLDSVDFRATFEGPTAMENRFILDLIGPLKGKKILDAGSGLGESSTYFAVNGANVTCTDLSPAMVDSAIALAQLHGAKINGVVSAGESLNVEAGSFDVVYIANTIHHVTDKEALFEGVCRALRPGGLFVSIDPLRYNPIIWAYRKIATAVRTADEAPLGFDAASVASKYFSDVHHREFWIASLSLFLKYYFVDGVHPNSDRYWKRIFQESNETLRWWLPLRKLDDYLTRVPGLRRLAWNMVIWGYRE